MDSNAGLQKVSECKCWQVSKGMVIYSHSIVPGGLLVMSQQTRRSLLHRLKNLENREAWENVFELYWRMMVAVVVLVVCLSAAGAARIAFNEETQEDNGPEFAKVIESAIRVELKKPTGELTEAVLAKVTSLNLNNTIMMDKGLKEIPKLKMLRSLNLNDTKVTRMGVARLQELFPNCKIFSNPKK